MVYTMPLAGMGGQPLRHAALGADPPEIAFRGKHHRVAAQRGKAVIPHRLRPGGNRREPERAPQPKLHGVILPGGHRARQERRRPAAAGKNLWRAGV